jgi:hypothetical protein
MSVNPPQEISTKRQIMILVPLNEADACRHSTSFYANEVMQPGDDVRFVFVTSSTGISKSTFDLKGATTEGLSMGAKHVKHDVRVSAHSLYPELRNILTEHNRNGQLAAMTILQE